MEKMKVRELMRPVSEFPKISCEATFAQAVDALEKAQQDYASGKAPQRILLVYDDTQKILGKLSPLDVVCGLEPNYDNIDSLKDLSYYRIPESVFENIKEKFRLWQQPLSKLCTKAVEIKIKNCIRKPLPNHILDVNDSMDKAFHLFVVGRNSSGGPTRVRVPMQSTGAEQSNKNALISAWITFPASLSAKRSISPAGINHKQQNSLDFPGPPCIPRSKSMASNSRLQLKKTHHS